MRLLFLCVANSARSQLAEGLARNLFKTSVDCRSAGSDPSGRVHLFALKALEELGINASQQRSKGIGNLEPDFLNSLNFIITLCKEESCPVLPAQVTQLNWEMPDPAAAPESEMMDSFRKIRDEIAAKLKDFGNEHGVLNDPP